MSTPQTPASNRSRWMLALLIFCVFLLVIVAIGDVLFAGTATPDAEPTATPTSMLFEPGASYVAYA
ncbi:hypothetical protein EKD04_011955 [Chloroflexales bacterium ZM16-3]|nr:hypothetical protein [Chloroflexales bacterium ZM16-3]